MSGYIDPLTASPGQYRLLLETDRVRVLEMNLKTGEIDNTHSHPNEVVYFITGSKVRLHLPDGDTAEAEFGDGDVMTHEPWTHQVQNIGSKDLKAIIVESKV